MGRFLTTRRAEWVPGVALAAAAVGIAALLGGGPGAWAFAAGVALGALVVGWILRLRRRPATPKARDGGPAEPQRGAGRAYDLEKDKSTDGQRWLM